LSATGDAAAAAARQPDDGRGPTGSEPIRVLIADDHALFRRGLEMVLDEEDDIELVGQASDGSEAVEKAGESLPDVVLMDIRMPRSSGIDACRAMKEVAPSAKIVMLTISDEEEDLFEAIRAGASGYLLKDLPLDEVAETVREIGLTPWSAQGTAERQAWVADLADEGLFGERGTKGFARESNWRTEADRILASIKSKTKTEVE